MGITAATIVPAIVAISFAAGLNLYATVAALLAYGVAAHALTTGGRLILHLQQKRGESR